MILVRQRIKKCPTHVLNRYKNNASSYNLCGQRMFKDKPLKGHDSKCYSCDEDSKVFIMGA